MFTTAIPSARGAYNARFSVGDWNLTKMDLTYLWNLPPELWAEENFVTLPTYQSTLFRVVKDYWLNGIHLFQLKQRYVVSPTQLFILSKTLYISVYVFHHQAKEQPDDGSCNSKRSVILRIYSCEGLHQSVCIGLLCRVGFQTKLHSCFINLA